MRTALAVAALVPRVAGGLLVDRTGRQRPRTVLGVPGRPGLLTDAWLTDALCRGVPGATVVGHRIGAVQHGTTSRQALTVTYDERGSAAGLPTWLYTKSAAAFGTRMVSASMGMGTLETGFYRDLRPRLAIEAPIARATAHDPRSHRLLLVLDDVTVTRGARFGTVVDDVVDRAGAEQFVDALAGLHGATWDAPFPAWLPDAATWLRRADRAIDVRGRCRSGLRRAADALPSALVDAADLPRLLWESVDTVPARSLRHGDVHLGNWYRTVDETVGLADWQCVTRGAWAHDLAYLLGSCLTVGDRRSWEVDLVRRFVSGLADSGADPGPDPFGAYRSAALHGLFMWLATIGRFPGQPRLQPDEVTLATLRRLGAQVHDLGTLERLRR